MNNRAAKNTNILLAHNLEAQITANSLTIRELQKYQSNDIGDVRFRYNQEENAIQEEMDELEIDSDEFASLKEELRDLKDMEDDEISAIENETAQKETQLQVQNENLEVRLEAIKADNEGLDEAIKQDIQSNFGYFQ